MWYSALGFLVTLTLSLLAAPLTADAQTLAKIPHIGIIAEWPEDSPYYGIFRQGLRELGYMEGQNIAIEWRITEGKLDRLADMATELVRLKMDIIVTAGTPATRAGMPATTTIPILMVSAGDPLRTGLVASLAQPGGDVTGSSPVWPEL